MGSQVNVGFRLLNQVPKIDILANKGQELIDKNDGHFDH
jgi:hypothetical protein